MTTTAFVHAEWITLHDDPDFRGFVDSCARSWTRSAPAHADLCRDSLPSGCRPPTLLLRFRLISGDEFRRSNNVAHVDAASLANTLNDENAELRLGHPECQRRAEALPWHHRGPSPRLFG
jgi:hypothetical protein